MKIAQKIVGQLSRLITNIGDPLQAIRRLLMQVGVKVKFGQFTCIGTENVCIAYRFGISYSIRPSHTDTIPVDLLAGLIPDIRPWIGRKIGELNYCIIQILSGYGYFRKYRHKTLDTQSRGGYEGPQGFHFEVIAL